MIYFKYKINISTAVSTWNSTQHWYFSAEIKQQKKGYIKTKTRDKSLSAQLTLLRKM